MIGAQQDNAAQQTLTFDYVFTDDWISLQLDTEGEFRRRCDSRFSVAYGQSARQRAMSVASVNNPDRKEP